MWVGQWELGEPSRSILGLSYRSSEREATRTMNANTEDILILRRELAQQRCQLVSWKSAAWARLLLSLSACSHGPVRLRLL